MWKLIDTHVHGKGCNIRKCNVTCLTSNFKVLYSLFDVKIVICESSGLNIRECNIVYLHLATSLMLYSVFNVAHVQQIGQRVPWRSLPQPHCLNEAAMKEQAPPRALIPVTRTRPPQEDIWPDWPLWAPLPWENVLPLLPIQLLMIMSAGQPPWPELPLPEGMSDLSDPSNPSSLYPREHLTCPNYCT